MMNIQRRILFALTLMLAGRAMTLAFIGRAGGTGSGDPPLPWLMPLIGDAVIGVTALFAAYLVWKGRGLFAWTAVVVWNVVAVWDAMSAYVVHITTPWPSFFMIELFGSSMFFMASAMHLLCLYLLCHQDTRERFLAVKA